jgi:hypothetical protein
MPKIPIDYSKTIMYKLVCNDLEVLYTYVGHSTNFKERKRCHKSNCNNENSEKYNLKVYKIIRENGGWENWTMIEIEKFPCNDINEATKRERYWYEILNADMNMINPNRPQIEYIENNKEKIKEYKQQLYQENKEIIDLKNKEWRENNKEKILTQRTKYYEKNKDKLLEKITCECGCIITKNSLLRHKKTKKHQDFINNHQD